MTDNKECTKSFSGTITQPTSITNPWSIRHVGCKGESSGFILSHVTGGVSNYTYALTPNVSNNDSAYLIPAGFYSLLVTDTNGCSRMDTITVTEPDTIVPLISTSTYIGAVKVKCFEDSTGRALITFIS